MSHDPSARVRALEMLALARLTLKEHDDLIDQYLSQSITYAEMCTLQAELVEKIKDYQDFAEMLDPRAKLWMLYTN
jgi:hypothetical protein